MNYQQIDPHDPLLEHPQHASAPTGGSRRFGTLRTILAGVCLGLVLALNLSQVSANDLPAVCSVGEESCHTSAGFTGVSTGSTSNTGGGLTNSRVRDFGQLIYDPDMKTIEAEARAALSRGLIIREALNPYSVDRSTFNAYVRQLDVASGFSAPLNTPIPNNPYTSASTLNDLIVAAEADFQRARDLYAYLLVFAPIDRFRADGDYITVIPSGDTKAPCDPNHPENPYPVANSATNPGEVLPPVVDWCDFHARLRQSAREGANLRMIYGQEFKVKALGVNFSANLGGANEFVVQEVANLRAAKFQYERAESSLSSALKTAIGNGCLVSDFFTQTEWSILSRASEEQGNVQYLIASRLSYLGAGSQADSQDEARVSFRQSANDQHAKLINLAGISGSPVGGCTVAGASQPDSALVADIASTMLEGRKLARQLSAGRNVFGFDTTATPARPYKTSTLREAQAIDCSQNEGIRGLWDQAMCSAEIAHDAQTFQINADRQFEMTQAQLRTAIGQVRANVDGAIFNASGCVALNLSETELITCVETALTNIETCLGLLTTPADATFDACVGNTTIGPIQGTDASTGLRALRVLYLQRELKEQEMRNIETTVRLSNDANKIIETATGTSGGLQTAAELAKVALDGVTCVDYGATAVIASSVGCALVATGYGVAAAAAGAASTVAEVTVLNANNQKETETLMLTLLELAIEVRAIDQQLLAGIEEMISLTGGLATDLRERRRQDAWFTASPANDPSFRLVRDSARLSLATELEVAAEQAYLAARRAEYEYAYPLFQANGFRISDIYRARTAGDIISFLNKLNGITGDLDALAIANPSDVTFSIAKDVLLLTDNLMAQALIANGNANPTPAQIEAERVRQFRLWAADNTNADGRLEFDFSTSLVEGGLFSERITDFSDQWLHKLNTMSVNLVTAQPVSGSPNGPITQRSIIVTQAGMTHMRSFAGCGFNYRLIVPGAITGFTLPDGVNPEANSAIFRANVNGQLPYSTNLLSTAGFKGRPISAMSWTVRVTEDFTDETAMDWQQLEDIKMIFNITQAQNAVVQDATLCTRTDW